MTVTPDSFRRDYGEFASEAAYPPSVVNYYLALGAIMMNQRRWGSPLTTADSPPKTQYDMGLELFVAHHITIEKQAMDAAKIGGTPGVGQGGPVSSKSTGPISISYDTGAAAELDAGHWNLTIYGKRFINMALMVGIGPIQVGIGHSPVLSGSPWVGPPPWPGWFG